jgi:peptidoglycan hydrolase-like protein with peptidoglycan-binding domain
METIRLGSTGPDVIKWQKIIGVDSDGKFGTNTFNATKAWQFKHKLVPDGVVGSATWLMATGEKGSPPVKQHNSNDEWAYQIAKAASPNMSEAERQYAVTVARGEGGYGKAWTGDGAGSNNWGAVQGTGDAGAFQHIDRHADGTQYTTNFKRYSTPEAGFLDMAKILLKPNVQSALKKGNLHDAVYAQHSNRYFELDPAKYFIAVSHNYAQLTSNVGWKKVLADNGVSFFGKLLTVVGIGTAVILGVRVAKLYFLKG